MKEKKEIISDIRRTGDLKKAGSLLGCFSKKLLGKKAFIEADIIANWGEIVGEDLAEYSTPVKVCFKKGERNNGVLNIETISGAFALEIQAKNMLIISKVNMFFGYNAIKAIKIIQNPVVFQKYQNPIHKSQKKLVTQDEENYIVNLGEDIKSKDLQLALQNLGREVIANNKK